VFVAIVFVVASVHLVARNSALLERVFVQAPLERGFRVFGGPDRIATDYHSNAFAPGSPMLRALMNNTAFCHCYEPVRLIPTAFPEMPLLFSDGDLKVFGTTFSPNRIDVRVVVGRDPVRLFLNQNYDPGWHSNVGPVTLDAEHNKMMVVVPAAYAGHVTFSYTPRGLMGGMALFAVAALALWLVIRRDL